MTSREWKLPSAKLHHYPKLGAATLAWQICSSIRPDKSIDYSGGKPVRRGYMVAAGLDR
jgi:hypothetical protein